MTCPAVTLNGLVMDAATPDADGIIWEVMSIVGWYDAADLVIARSPQLPVGEIITAVHEQARAVVLEADARTATPNATALGDLCYAAQDRAKVAGNLIYASGLMTVTDGGPSSPLHAQVRRAEGTSVHCAIIGNLHHVRVQWALIAEDPRRWETDDVHSHH